MDIVKEAVKKVIAAMTVGTDVSMLFTDVLKRMQTADLELKKLVYLYIMNYAKSKPDLAILAVNTFKRDTRDKNALIRAMAVRTMGCIRVEKITEYLTTPLRQTLKDSDPYVRKTAAVCVAKLFDISPELVSEQGFLDMLHDLVSDSNPMVVANAVAALTEIHDSSEVDVLRIDSGSLRKLLVALNECTEWGQVSILDALAFYTPKSPREAETIVERVVPRLNHANAAVVLSAIKVVLVCIDKMEDPKSTKQLVQKLSAPLVSMMSSAHGQSPEIQYVALRNIALIVQKQPKVLMNDVKIFFCAYDDPIYVKMEKLEILVQLASERNIEQVLLELKEATTREVDVDFVKTAVRAIGRCAIKLPRAASRCINVLLELIKTKVTYIVQEAIVIIKDVFRKYPNHYESIIPTLCDSLTSLSGPGSKAAMIWIIGEYAEKIDNADESLQFFIDSFEDEDTSVKLQLVTAVVKLFLKKPKQTKAMVKRILEMATEESDDADLKDRGYVYWRLLSADPKAAKAVVLAEKAVISDDSNQIEPQLLESLVRNLSTLSSVYHKPPEAFVSFVPHRVDIVVNNDDDESDSGDEEDEQSADENSGEEQQQSDEEDSKADAVEDDMDDLLGLSFTDDSPTTTTTSNDGLDDIFGMSTTATPQQQEQVQLHRLVSSDKGLDLQGALVCKNNGERVFRMQFGDGESGKYVIQFNKNPFGYQHQKGSFQPDASGMYDMPIGENGQKVDKFTSGGIQAAMKAKNGQFEGTKYFYIPWELAAVANKSDGPVEKSKYGNLWKSKLDNQAQTMFGSLVTLDLDQIRNMLKTQSVLFVNQTEKGGNQTAQFYSMRLNNGKFVLIELRFKQGIDACKAIVKSHDEAIAKWTVSAIQKLLQK